MSDSPSVVVVGGGPGGLLASILLGQQGIATTVLEKSNRPDQWNTKSYSIQLGPRGMDALEKASLLDEAKEFGMPRKHVILFDGQTGEQKKIPKPQGTAIGLSRPRLVSFLEEKAAGLGNITIVKDCAVSRVELQPDGSLQVISETGETFDASHVIGADGKWSKVRQSFPELDSQATVVEEPSFGVHVMVPTVPEELGVEGATLVKPANEETFYIIAAPIPTGEVSVSLVVYDEAIEKFPWLAPPEGERTTEGWEAEYSALPTTVDSTKDLSDNLENLLHDHVPAFLSAIGRDALRSARINRRTSWVKMDSSGGVNFATSDGRVVLIGDAAHAVTPSMAEGCNLALESAAQLAESLGGEPNIEELSEAFLKFGKDRPREVEPVQTKSASRSRMQNGPK